MTGHRPFKELSKDLPQERQARVAAKAAKASAPRGGETPKYDEAEVRAREAVLDKLVADAQEHDMGYRRY